MNDKLALWRQSYRDLYSYTQFIACHVLLSLRVYNFQERLPQE